MRAASLVCFVALLGLCQRTTWADTFTYIDENGQTVTVEARLAGSGQGMHALELANGETRVVPQQAVRERKSAPGPDPARPETILAQLREKFGAESFRGYVDEPYVLGLVLSAPLSKQHEVRATAFLKKAGRFMKTVEGVLLDFTKDVRLETHSPTHPLVVLIFETDKEFEKFTTARTEGRGLSAGRTAGFYDPVSNYLVIRMSECNTFEVPLHEAIHQLVHNRGILNRLAPAPAWFNEGIATGFEANGERINIGPLKINSRYGRMVMQTRTVGWDEVIGNDRAFHGDVLAGEAYAHAWALHWFLVTKYRKEYTEYVRRLGQKQPLEPDDAEQRRQEFRDAFGKSVAELEKEFPQWLEAGVKRQKVSLAEKETPGVITTTTNLGEVEVTAVRRLDQGGALEVQGKLRNISTVRPMTFHVMVQTDAGTYADWLIPNLATQKTAPLPKQHVQKRLPNAPGGPSSTFTVRVRSTVPDSDQAKNWQRGEVPLPIGRE